MLTWLNPNITPLCLIRFELKTSEDLVQSFLWRMSVGFGVSRIQDDTRERGAPYPGVRFASLRPAGRRPCADSVLSRAPGTMAVPKDVAEVTMTSLSNSNDLAAELPEGRVCSQPVSARPRPYVVVKAATDRVLAALLLVLFGPLILLLLVIVRVTSGVPALYSQTQLGRGGHPYRTYKVRTAQHDGACLTGPRVTPLGRTLRRCHLDALPLLWNVLRGEMSLVGPRPERPEITEQLGRALPRYRERLRVRPGITGLAQVLLPPDEHLASVRRRFGCDIYYAEHMSPLLDAKVAAAATLKLFGTSVAWRRRLLRLPTGDEPMRMATAAVAEREPASRLQTA